MPLVRNFFSQLVVHGPITNKRYYQFSSVVLVASKSRTRLQSETSFLLLSRGHAIPQARIFSCDPLLPFASEQAHWRKAVQTASHPVQGPRHALYNVRAPTADDLHMSSFYGHVSSQHGGCYSVLSCAISRVHILLRCIHPRSSSRTCPRGTY